jgi:hypothetical protein
MAYLSDLISEDNEVFRAYCFWSSILVLKMLSMAFLTGRQRYSKKVSQLPKVLLIFIDEEINLSKYT